MPGSVGGPEQRSQIVRIFDAVQSKKESVLSGLAGKQQVLDPQEPSLSNHCEHALMSIRPGKPGKLVSGFQRHADTCRSAELHQPFEAIVSAFPSDADMVKLPRTRTNGLLDRVETVKNFHPPSLLSKWKNSRKDVECLWTENRLDRRAFNTVLR